MRIAAVVGTVGHPALSTCLASLRESTEPVETVVVDQSDRPDQIRAVVEAQGARHLRAPSRGLSRARNLGIAATAAPWLFFPDDDCVPDARFAERVLASLDADPGVRFACGRVVDEHGRALAPDMGASSVEIETMRDVLRTAMSTGLVVHREVFGAVGGFDETLGVGGEWPSGEESDLVVRARRAGFRGRYVPDAVVVHPQPFEIRDAREQARRARDYGRGWGALFAKHGRAPLAPGVLLLFANYLARAAVGSAWAYLTGRRDLGARYAASLSGRWAGFVAYRRAAE